MTPNVAPLQIQRFWTDFAPDIGHRDPDDPAKWIPGDPAKLKAVDMIAYGPVGRIDNALNIAKVSTILNVKPFTDPNDPASVMAHVRSDFVRRAYDAWKAGQDIPIDGTPLAAWNGITPEQAEVFRSKSIRTVEEISILNEATRAHVPLPGLSSIIAAAKRFVDSADQTRFAAQMAAKDEEIAAVKSQSADMSDQLAMLTARLNEMAEKQAKRDAEQSEPKNKGGRPTNAERAARAEAAAQTEAA